MLELGPGTGGWVVRNFEKYLHDPLAMVKERTGKQQVACCRDGSETLDFEE